MDETSSALIQFEEGYVFKNFRSITTTADIALTEFVANAWDAGANTVRIVISKEDNNLILIEDNGIGMNDEEFKKRWMTLSFSRQNHQGSYVEFPKDVTPNKRVAYGRNGIGRHGVCFVFLILMLSKHGKMDCVINMK
jgi:hypothetical protein